MPHIFFWFRGASLHAARVTPRLLRPPAGPRRAFCSRGGSETDDAAQRVHGRRAVDWPARVHPL
eukprot:2270809-Pyramimonas_sp.AAC.1